MFNFCLLVAVGGLSEANGKRATKKMGRRNAHVRNRSVQKKHSYTNIIPMSGRRLRRKNRAERQGARKDWC